MITLDNEEPGLAIAKELKRDEIANARFQRETKDIMLNGVLFAADRFSQGRIFTLRRMFTDFIVNEVDWKLSDGSFVTLNDEQSLLLARSLAHQVQQAFSWERQKTAELAAATTIEAVQAIDLS